MNLVLLWLALTASTVNASSLASSLEKYGLQSVQPPSDAPNFSLPDTSGRLHTLSSQHGRWVLLTFWATWCGPCVKELPSLQKLHEKLGNQEITVLAVAIGSETSQVKSFVDTHKLSFPVVIDQGDRVAAMYRATSVPVSFVIDPTGRVVGIARGARDWTQAIGLMETLIGKAAAPDQAENRYADKPDQSLELPSSVVPPSAEVELSDPEPQTGRAFVLKVHITWAGHLQDYLLHPPSVQLPENVIQEGIEASSTSQAGNQKITYRIRLTAKKEGAFALDPVELRYTPHLEGKPLTARILGPTIQVHTARIMGLESTWFFTSLGALGLGCGIMVVMLLRKRRSSSTAKSEIPKEVHWSLSLQELHELRVSGDLVGFLKLVQNLRKELEPEGLENDESLQSLLERVRYGNQQPDERELDRLERQLELWIKNKTGTKDVLAEEGIRLAD